MLDAAKIIPMTLMSLFLWSSCYSADKLELEVGKIASRLGCSKAVDATEAKLGVQKSRSLLFHCKEFSPKRVGIEEGALVISGKDNRCPEIIADSKFHNFQVIAATTGFELGTKYGDLRVWKESPRNLKYAGKNKNEFVSGNVVKICFDKACSVSYTYTCAADQWVFIGRD